MFEDLKTEYIIAKPKYMHTHFFTYLFKKFSNTDFHFYNELHIKDEHVENYIRMTQNRTINLHVIFPFSSFCLLITCLLPSLKINVKPKTRIYGLT